jgi:hypothetical protein
MNCKECKNKLSDFFSKGENAEEMQKHLAECKQCRFLFEKIQDVAPEKIRLIDENPKEFFISRCEAKLDNALENEKNFSFFPREKPVLLSLSFALAIVLGFSLGNTMFKKSVFLEQETVIESEYSSVVSIDNYQSYYAE